MKNIYKMQEVVVGIDFGTSGIGYAYSFNDPKNIELGKFQGQNIGIKVPTEIIIDSNFQNVLAFGVKCSSYDLKEGNLFFKGIKMNIYKNLSDIKPINSRKSFSLIEVIRKIIEYVKNDAFNSIKFNRPNISEEQIKWIITVPAIWNHHQRGIMISACEKAGLFNKHTDRENFLALEPEVASLYCSNDNSIDLSYLSSGKAYIVCDLGGGTGDMVAHHRTKDNKIEERYHPVGGPYGSEEIEYKFNNEVIGKIFGFNDFNGLKDKFNDLLVKKKLPPDFEWDEKYFYNQWHDFQENIKKNKCITNEQKDKTFFINCGLFKDFTDGVDINVLVEEYNESCPSDWKINIKSKKNWILEIPLKIIFNLIEEHALKITEQISEICENTKIKDIESILFVGGYCSNEILINYIINKFPKLTPLKPSCPERAVVKGAVIFGIDPYIINLRKSMYTIGFNCDDIWDDSVHGGIGEKYYDSNYNIYKCKNSFHVLIRKGQDLSQEEKDYIEESFITMDSKTIYLKFFKSSKERPILYTEEGVELIGNEQINLGKDFLKNERNFTLRLKFGGTFASASCFHKESGKELIFPLYFNK